MNRIAAILAGALVALMLLSSMLFIVDQRQFAAVYALGEIKEVITEPGLKFKLPPPLQNVVLLDRRVQTLDSPESRPIFTAEKKSLVIDWLIKWRITEPRQFIRNSGPDTRNVENRLAPIVQAAFNEEVTKRTVLAVLATEREKVMNDVRARLADEAKQFGIEVVDVRIKRVDFASSITDSVYRRMQSERQRVASVPPRARRSRPTPTASARSSSPRPTAMHRRSRVRAMPRLRPCTPRPSAVTPPSPSSTDRWRPTAPASATRAT